MSLQHSVLPEGYPSGLKNEFDEFDRISILRRSTAEKLMKSIDELRKRAGSGLISDGFLLRMGDF